MYKDYKTCLVNKKIGILTLPYNADIAIALIIQNGFQRIKDLNLYYITKHSKLTFYIFTDIKKFFVLIFSSTCTVYIQ